MVVSPPGIEFYTVTKLFIIAGFMSFLATAAVPAVVGQANSPEVQQVLASSQPELYIFSGAMIGMSFMFLGALRYLISTNAKSNSETDVTHAKTVAGIIESHDKRDESSEKIIEAVNSLTTAIATNSERMNSICQARPASG